MFKKLVKFSIVLLCGYLVTKWITIPYPFVLSDFFIGIVIKPLQFFAAAIALFIGMLLNGDLIRGTITRTKKAWRKQIPWSLPILLEYCCFGFVFYLIFYFGWEQAIIFFSLGLLYGMISVEN